MSPRVVIAIVCMTIAIAQLIQICTADRCKKKIQTNYFDRCNLRSKRSSPIFDSISGYPSDKESVHNQHAVKRQIMSIREIFVASRVPSYHIPYPSYIRHEHIPAVPPVSEPYIYRGQAPKAGSLPQESHSEVGFEMSYEEMIELFEEFYQRMPRGTKSRAEMQRDVWAMIEQCCKNIDHCKKIDCPYV